MCKRKNGEKVNKRCTRERLKKVIRWRWGRQNLAIIPSILISHAIYSSCKKNRQQHNRDIRKKKKAFAKEEAREEESFRKRRSSRILHLSNSPPSPQFDNGQVNYEFVSNMRRNNPLAYVFYQFVCMLVPKKKRTIMKLIFFVLYILSFSL